MKPAPIHVLLLEDNPNDALLVQQELAAQAPGEFAVTTAERLADALARIQAERFDVVMCDLGLPDSAGLGTAQAIVAHAPVLPLVVLTGSEDTELGRAAIELGAQDYVMKGSVKPQLISRAIRYAIERKRLETQLREANESLNRRIAERTADLEAANCSLRASEARYRQLFAETSLVTLLIDPADGRIVESNRAASAYYGWDQERLQSMNIGDVNTLSAEEVHAELERTRTLGKLRFDFRHRLASGEVRDVEVYSSPVSEVGEGGRPLLHSIVIDVNARKQAEAALQEASDALRRKNDELERFNKVSIGRELDMIELKRQMNALARELGRAEPFNLAFADAPPAPTSEAKDSAPPAAGASR